MKLLRRCRFRGPLQIYPGHEKCMLIQREKERRHNSIFFGCLPSTDAISFSFHTPSHKLQLKGRGDTLLLDIYLEGKAERVEWVWVDKMTSHPMCIFVITDDIYRTNVSDVRLTNQKNLGQHTL